MQTPSFVSEKMRRPALWGVLISSVALGLVFLTRAGYGGFLERAWGDRQAAYRTQFTNTVQTRFTERVQELLSVASEVRKDHGLLGLLKADTPTSIAAAFSALDRHRTINDVSLDIADPQGSVVVWAGKSVVESYRSIFDTGEVDTFVVISPAGLHRFLSVGISTADASAYVIASRTVEVNYPLSNRFVSRSSFSDDISGELGTSVRLLFEEGPPDLDTTDTILIPLLNLHRRPIAYALVSLPTLAEASQAADGLAALWSKIIAGIGALLIAFVVLTWPLRSTTHVLQFVLLASTVWSVRVIWRIVDFPSVLVGGALFDPAVYASPFLFSLTSSLGELFLSCTAVLVTAFGLFITVERLCVNPVEKDEGVSWAKRSLYVLLVFILAVVLQFVIRGYGAAMRSFVLDSTLRYQDPSSLVPEGPVVAMHLTILILTFSFILVVFAILFFAARTLSRSLPQLRRTVLLPLLTFIFLGGHGVFILVNRIPQTPLYYPMLVILLGVALVGWYESRRVSVPMATRITWRRALFMGATIFILSALLIDSKLHEKERLRVQMLADELLRPVDSWLSFVVTEGIRAAARQPAGQFAAAETDTMDASNLAFKLWAQTLMSREGYNSGVFIYNSRGVEVSRFSVGMTSYEQVDLLSKVFDVEEEVLHVSERNLPHGAIRYYGAWSTVRDDNEQALGTVAVLLSASQKSLFRGETPEPLRAASRDRSETTFESISMSEYEDSVLVSTNDEFLNRGSRLPTYVLEELRRSEARFIWSEVMRGNSTLDVLFARDESNPGRVLAVGLKSVDSRWRLFNLVKMFTVYLVFFIVGIVTYALLRSVRRRAPVFGFREKLVSSFALLSILPLVVMAYYNRELAVERLNENITRRLSEDLFLLHQRIASTVHDAADFSGGVNNEYCEILASDLGVDFAVYGRSRLQSSSRPELYRTAILDGRLPGDAFANVVLLQRNIFKDTERIGEVEYIVGYRPIVLGGRFVGVLAVPALYRLQEIDEELAQRNAFIIGAYALVLLFIVAGGIALANRLSRPLRELSRAARTVGAGNLDVQVEPRSGDEVGELVRSFNDMTRQLKASRDNLARVERELAWKEMAKQVAHEIRNPLTPMKLSMQHLLRAYRDGAKEFGDILQRVSQTVIEQIETLSRIASEFSNFARMPERAFERVDVNTLLNDTLKLFAEVGGIEFRSRFSDVPATLIADKDELRRVFINIIRNSIQAMERGGVIAIETEVKDYICRVTISDSGSGIPPELQEKVFQPSFSTKTDGMGIGLAIAQKIVQDLDGTIGLQSEVGKGTTIVMQFPLKRA